MPTTAEPTEAPVRIALAVLVVAALVAVGVRAGLRVLERQEDEPGRATPEEVAAEWAAATTDVEVERLAELAAERADGDVLRATHEAVLPLLDDLAVTVEEVAVGAGTGDNRAVAALAWSARPGGGDGEWTWTSELELIRARGVWSVDWEPSMLHPRLAPGWRLEVVQLPPSRAPILDRDGAALSPTGANVEIGVQPGRLPDEERLLSTVTTALPEARSALRDLLEREDLVDDWYYPLVTVSAERADEAWLDLVSLPGLIRREAEGGVGAAIAAPEVVGAIEVGEDGTRRGVAGLEQRFDDRLSGSATTEVRLLDPEDGLRDTLFTFQSEPAPPLVTTLDREVQQAVDDAVIAVDDPVGVVVLDPASAGVLAVASRPATGYPRALEGRYPPGAVAGLVPLAAALRDGASADDPVECPTEATVGGVRITTRGTPPASPTLTDVLGGGCDVALARLGVAAGDAALLEALAVLGLGAELPLPVPALGWSWPSAATDAALASWSVGHGRVETSALGAAQLAATVARGAPAVPVLLDEEVVTDPDPLPQQLVTGLRTAMRQAGEDGPVRVDGARVAGFAARSGGVGGDPAPATGWWVGFVEGGGRDIALAVVVEDGDDARAVAIAQRVARELVG